MQPCGPHYFPAVNFPGTFFHPSAVDCRVTFFSLSYNPMLFRALEELVQVNVFVGQKNNKKNVNTNKLGLDEVQRSGLDLFLNYKM